MESKRLLLFIVMNVLAASAFDCFFGGLEVQSLDYEFLDSSPTGSVVALCECADPSELTTIEISSDSSGDETVSLILTPAEAKEALSKCSVGAECRVCHKSIHLAENNASSNLLVSRCPGDGVLFHTTCLIGLFYSQRELRDEWLCPCCGMEFWREVVDLSVWYVRQFFLEPSKDAFQNVYKALRICQTKHFLNNLAKKEPIPQSKFRDVLDMLEREPLGALSDFRCLTLACLDGLDDDERDGSPLALRAFLELSSIISSGKEERIFRESTALLLNKLSGEKLFSLLRTVDANKQIGPTLKGRIICWIVDSTRISSFGILSPCDKETVLSMLISIGSEESRASTPRILSLFVPHLIKPRRYRLVNLIAPKVKSVRSDIHLIKFVLSLTGSETVSKLCRGPSSLGGIISLETSVCEEETNFLDFVARALVRIYSDSRGLEPVILGIFLVLRRNCTLGWL